MGVSIVNFSLDACTCTNLDGDMLSRNTLRTCEWSLQGYKALSWENLAPQGIHEVCVIV